MGPDRSQPFAWWGPPEWGSPEPMSIPRLIEAGDLDVRVAAVLWVIMERSPSVIIAAMPRLAGKTTLLTALLDFLSPEMRPIYLRGKYETFDFIPYPDPSAGLLLVNELSDHLPYYLWDEGARGALELLVQGFSLSATMHTDSPEDVAAQLEEGTGVDAATLGHLTAVVNLEVRRNLSDHRGEPLRRVRTVTLVGSASGGLAFSTIARWDPATDRFALPADTATILAAKVGVDPKALAEDLRRRELYLAKVQASGPKDRDAFQRAVLGYDGHATRSSP